MYVYYSNSGMARNLLIALEAYNSKNYTTDWLQTWNIACNYLSAYSTDEFNMQ